MRNRNATAMLVRRYTIGEKGLSVPPMAPYKRTRDEHWLRDKQEQGQSLTLEDDSSWEIHPSDRSVTARWLRGSMICVEQTQSPEYQILVFPARTDAQ